MRIRNRNNRAALRKLLSRPRYDGVVNAVHYTPEGQVDWVRAYERRGPTWSDNVLLNRQALIGRLKAGKRFYIGKRVEFEGGEFEVSEPLSVIEGANGPILRAGRSFPNGDDLGALPVI